MSKFDVENFRDYLRDVLQAGMAAKAAEINAEKGDSLLSDIPSDQYVRNYNDTVLNFDLVLYYKIARIETGESRAGGTDLSVSVVFAVVFSNQDDWDAAESKILRYTRAMLEIFTESGYKNSQISDLRIEPFEPDMVQLSENSPVFQAGGVQVTGVITA